MMNPVTEGTPNRSAVLPSNQLPARRTPRPKTGWAPTVSLNIGRNCSGWSNMGGICDESSRGTMEYIVRVDELFTEVFA